MRYIRKARASNKQLTVALSGGVSPITQTSIFCHIMILSLNYEELSLTEQIYNTILIIYMSSIFYKGLKKLVNSDFQ
jgi:predicted PP-loop superfamily ATPase